MMKRTLRAALATAVLAMGAASVQAETPAAAGETLQIRVVNYHKTPVRVYVVDTFGRTTSLGWVNRSHTEILTVPASVAKLGAVRLKVIADDLFWAPTAASDAIGTRPLNLRPGDVVNFLIETELTDSHLQITRT